MNKETIKRDSKGRFAKKEKPATKEQIKQIERYIKQLEKERDMYKRLSERFGGDYLTKCAELGEVKRNLSAYEKYWPQLREIAKTWKKRASSLSVICDNAIDALSVYSRQLRWSIDKLPWYKKILFRKKLKKFDYELVELLDKLIRSYMD